MAPSSPMDIAFMQTVPYVSAVGALMFLAIAMHPDIAQAVGVLCRFMSNPGPEHWKAVKHLFCYLHGSVDLCLTYAPDPSSPDLFCMYSDADHSGNPDNGCSTSAYMLKIGTGMISWSSKLQSIVAVSTTEAEFVAAISAGQETIWMHQFLSDLGYSFSGPSLVLMEISWAFRLARTRSIMAA
jgi:hypothetical protein